MFGSSGRRRRQHAHAGRGKISSVTSLLKPEPTQPEGHWPAVRVPRALAGADGPTRPGSKEEEEEGEEEEKKKEEEKKDGEKKKKRR